MRVTLIWETTPLPICSITSNLINSESCPHFRAQPLRSDAWRTAGAEGGRDQAQVSKQPSTLRLLIYGFKGCGQLMHHNGRKKQARVRKPEVWTRNETSLSWPLW